MKKLSKLFLIGALYFAQGLPFGFFISALPALFRQAGASLSFIGFLYLLELPWALKFFYAPIIDRYGNKNFGHRRSWIIPLQVGLISVTIVLAFIQIKAWFWGILLGVFLASLFASAQDTATDGLAIDLLPYEERGSGNAVQVAAYRVGMMVGGGFLLITFDWWGWTVTLSIMASLLMLAMLPVLFHKEHPKLLKQTEHKSRPLWPAILSFLSTPGAALWLASVGIYKAGYWLAGGMLRPMLVDSGIKLKQIGWLLGIVSFGFALLGAFFGGYFTNRLGRTRALIIFGFIQAISVGMLIIPSLGLIFLPVLAPILMFEYFAGGLTMVALFTIMMDQCRTEQAATDYSIQSCVVAIAALLAPAAGGAAAQYIGYTNLFIIATALCFVGIAMIGLAIKSFDV